MLQLLLFEILDKFIIVTFLSALEHLSNLPWFVKLGEDSYL